MEAFTAPTYDLSIILPVLIVGGWGVLLMILDMIVPEEKQGWSSWTALGGLSLATIAAAATLNEGGMTFTSDRGLSMLVVDGYVHYLNLIFLITGILAVFISMPYLQKAEIEEHTEYYMLMLFSIAGMMLMGMANDLILVFIALELLSIPLYVMCGIARPREASEESAMKYFLLGAFASSFLVFGIALLYGAAGSTALPVVAANFISGGTIAYAGLGMVLVGLAFKVGAVPFHMWTPDVYEGAPTAVTAFMSVGAKVGGFAALIRLFAGTIPLEAADVWVPAVVVISAATMILGNVVAISQQNMKRMLAYSSIAHGGYILMAVAAIPYTADAVSATLTYMMTYMFTNLGAFAMITMRERSYDSGTMLDDYKGIARQNPGLALVLAYFMFSLIGMPLTGGFIGKFVVFRSVLDAGMNWSVPLAVLGVLTSAVSAYYYLRVVFYMFMYEGDSEMKSQPTVAAAAALALVATIFIGIAPAAWIDFARDAFIMTTQTLIAGG